MASQRQCHCFDSETSTVFMGQSEKVLVVALGTSSSHNQRLSMGDSSDTVSLHLHWWPILIGPGSITVQSLNNAHVNTFVIFIQLPPLQQQCCRQKWQASNCWPGILNVKSRGCWNTCKYLLFLLVSHKSLHYVMAEMHGFECFSSFQRALSLGWLTH